MLALLTTSLALSVSGKSSSSQPRRPSGYIPFDGPVKEVILTPRPHTYLKESDLPSVWDWRNINGTNYCNHVYSQEAPNHCGSCWAEAATGALSDRYSIATQGKLRVSLAPQQLLNFNPRTTGGSCEGGDHVKAYEFMHTYGISDDTCGAKIGLDRLHSFHVAAMTDVEDVRDHQCFECEWTGPCDFVDRTEYNVNLYGVDEYGSLSGIAEMKSEIYARGPIACLINSEPPEFNNYRGGIITCDASKNPSVLCNVRRYTDHVIIIAGWGKDELTGQEYWVGRNSYGTKWGEGAGGGWFRVALGSNTLNIESSKCSFAVPAKENVEIALEQHYKSLGMQYTRK